MSSSEQQRLEKEIEELRGELGETVEALVHKVDVPARAKERGSELAEQALERGIELQQQAAARGSELVERGNEFKDEVLERGNEFKDLMAERSSELRDRAVDAVERARVAVNQMPSDRWVKLASAGFALIVFTIIVRRMRAA